MSDFRDAQTQIRGDGRADVLARASLAAAESKFGSRRPDRLLRVDLVGAGQVNAHIASIVNQAIQDATAKVGHILRDPRSEATRSHPADRDRAPLIPRGQSGGTFFFGFPADQPSAGPDILGEPVASLSERAAFELVEILPRDVADDRALDAVLGQRLTVRSAVNDLVVAVRNVQADIGLQLSTARGDAIRSSLTRQQAGVLQESLLETRTQHQQITLKGILDGVRTQRRIFYLVPESGAEIQGAVEAELMPAIRENLGREVIATLVREQIETRAGRKGRPTYRLVDLGSEPKLQF